MTTDFVPLLDFENDYEIMVEYPNVIRKKANGKILKERINKIGYLVITLNAKTYLKHRVLARQFIPNPDNLPMVDHKNKNKVDNRIENLRWVTNQENQLNRKKSKNIEYEFVDSLPDDLTIEVEHYGRHNFEFYYFNQEDNNFYFFNGVCYRKLYIKELPNSKNLLYVTMTNKENKKVNVYINKFKKEYELI